MASSEQGGGGLLGWLSGRQPDESPDGEQPASHAGLKAMLREHVWATAPRRNF